MVQASRMIWRFSKSLYSAFIKGHSVTFAVTVFLNFLGRVFNLAAFVVSIQSIYIAFQSSASSGASFRGKHYFDMLGLDDSSLPIILALLVMIVFMMPSFLKILETRLIARITKDVHRRCLDQKVSVSIDFFVTSRGPILLTNMCRFFSGTLFIVIALVIVALFRIDLFSVVLAISFSIVAIVVISNWHQISHTADLVPKQLSYIREARHAYDPKRAMPITEVPTHKSTAREAHFNTSLRNWARVSRAALYQVALMGVATATVILFVFRMDDLDESKLFMLLYLIIAIRYAMNTGRETGTMASKILDLRSENTTIAELAQVRSSQI